MIFQPPIDWQQHIRVKQELLFFFAILFPS